MCHFNSVPRADYFSQRYCLEKNLELRPVLDQTIVAFHLIHRVFEGRLSRRMGNDRLAANFINFRYGLHLFVCMWNYTKTVYEQLQLTIITCRCFSPYSACVTGTILIEWRKRQLSAHTEFKLKQVYRPMRSLAHVMSWSYHEGHRPHLQVLSTMCMNLLVPYFCLLFAVSHTRAAVAALTWITNYSPIDVVWTWARTALQAPRPNAITHGEFFYNATNFSDGIIGISGL